MIPKIHSNLLDQLLPVANPSPPIDFPSLIHIIVTNIIHVHTCMCVCIVVSVQVTVVLIPMYDICTCKL